MARQRGGPDSAFPRPPFVSEAEIRALGLTPGDLRHAIVTAFRNHHLRREPLVTKIGVHPPSGGLFHAMPAVLDDIAIMKWVASGHSYERVGGKHIHATTIVSDTATGETLAILDAGRLTALRSAAVTAAVADLAAAPDARTFGVIGCGLQARTHLDALRAIRPLDRVVAYSHREMTRERYASEVRAAGIACETTNEPGAVLEAADILLTAIPYTTSEPSFLDAGAVKPGTFVASLDLGRSWRPETLAAFDRFVTDDRSHSAEMVRQGLLDFDHEFDRDLCELLASGADYDPQRRTLLIPPGLALGDAALAKLVIDRLGYRTG